MLLELKNIGKTFDDTAVLRSVSLSLVEGEILALLGPSGCGKTTLLRIIAGLEKADEGSLFLRGSDLTTLPVFRREFGFVFQDYALFPHRTVFQNVGFGLRMLGWDHREITNRVNQVLDLVGMAGYADRGIHELSGGERQRAALARSLAPAPQLLLLDEPLGALDRALRERLMLELRAILKRAGGIIGRPGGITAIYVTHDQSEALAIADRVAVMNEGQIVQVDEPKQLYSRPATAFVAGFLGMNNLLQGEVLSIQPCLVRTVIGDLTVEGSFHHLPDKVGEAVTVLVRPDAARFVAKGEGTMSGRLKGVSFRGRYQIATIVISGPPAPVELNFEIDSTDPLPEKGAEIQLELMSRAIVLLRAG